LWLSPCIAWLCSAFLSAQVSTTAIYGQSTGVYNHYFKTFLYPMDLVWSFLLAVALFFKFSRFLSMRNWDVVSIFLLVPGLSFLVILGLHGVYLLWLGLPVLMQARAEKALPYAAAVAGCGLLIAVGLGLIVAPLFSAPG